MLETQRTLVSDVVTPIGHVKVIGTAEGSGRNRNRVLHSYAWLYLAAGHGSYRDELGTVRQLRAGDCVVLFPGMQHSYGAPSGGHWKEIFVVFDGPLFVQLESCGILDRRRPVTRLDPCDRWAERCHRLAEWPLPDNVGAAMHLATEFLQLLVAALAGSPREPDWLALARAVLDRNLAAPMDLPAAAATLGVGVETFRKRFRRVAGISPGKYRDRRRIATAAELLRSTTLGHREIAAAVGFSDEFHFSKRFKVVTGVAPREFRVAAAHGAQLPIQPALGG